MGGKNIFLIFTTTTYLGKLAAVDNDLLGFKRDFEALDIYQKTS